MELTAALQLSSPAEREELIVLATVVELSAHTAQIAEQRIDDVRSDEVQGFDPASLARSERELEGRRADENVEAEARLAARLDQLADQLLRGARDALAGLTRRFGG